MEGENGNFDGLQEIIDEFLEKEDLNWHIIVLASPMIYCLC